MRIGRSRDNDLILPNDESATSSGRHAEARVDSTGTWWIEDKGSSNGTRVNGVSTTAQALRSGDRLTFGGDEFLVTIERGKRRSLVAVGIAALLIAGAVGFALSRSVFRPSFERAAREIAPAVFMVALEEDGRRTIAGTAFVAAPGRLATSAHIADALSARDALSNGRVRAVAVESGGAPVVPVTAVKVHPRWRRGSIDGDAALLEVGSAQLPAPLRFATSQNDDVRPGTLLGTFGFPAVATNAARPVGRLSVDVVAGVRAGFLEIGLGIAPGISGSPVFDESGLVVGMVAGGDFVQGPNGLPVPSGSSQNWAIGIAALRELLATR